MCIINNSYKKMNKIYRLEKRENWVIRRKGILKIRDFLLMLKILHKK